MERGRAGRQAREATESRGIQAKAELEKVRLRLQEAEDAQRRTADQATAARTVWQQAREHLKELTQLDGSKVCRHCGQALTEGHLKEEKRRRTEAVAAAAAAMKQAGEAQQAAQQRERQVRAEFDQVEHGRNDLRVEYAAQKKEEEQAQADAVRIREECGQVYGELPETYRVRVALTLPADWLATTYPAASDLASPAPRRPDCRRRGSCCSRRSRSATSGTSWRRKRPPNFWKSRAYKRNCRPTSKRSAANTPGWRRTKRAWKRA